MQILNLSPDPLTFYTSCRVESIASDQTAPIWFKEYFSPDFLVQVTSIKNLCGVSQKYSIGKGITKHGKVALAMYFQIMCPYSGLLAIVVRMEKQP